MRKLRALALKVAAPQEARLVGLQVVRQAVQPVELQVVQPAEVLQEVQPVPVRQAQLGLEPELLEPELLQEQRLALQEPWQAQLLGLWGPLAWLVR
jgi:hypothetical protein